MPEIDKRIMIKKDKKAQAFMIAFLVFSVLVMFALTLSDMWYNSLDVNVMVKDGIRAFYAAQAGLEHGKAYADITGSTPGGTNWLPCNSSNVTVVNNSSCWFTDMPGQWYQFLVNGSAGNRSVYAKGRQWHPDLSGCRPRAAGRWE